MATWLNPLLCICCAADMLSRCCRLHPLLLSVLLLLAPHVAVYGAAVCPLITPAAEAGWHAFLPGELLQAKRG
jgi:hypothetical protein